MGTTTKKKLGRPKDLGKTAAIMEAAGTLFMEHGLLRVTVKEIADAAGVSKLTVYNHFGNKNSLFQSVIRHECEKYIGEPLFEQLDGQEPSRELRQIALGFMEIFYSPGAVALYRVALSEGSRDPDVSKLYYEAAPQRVLGHFADYLRRVEKHGVYTFTDKDEAGGLFFSLLQGDAHMKVMLGLAPRPQEQDLDSLVNRAVDLFLKYYR